ncbi:MAG: N-acetylmuramoyl-L-alanine amidase [Candidatus Omnitrophica bacterium]|nr:N-acetylmuramoyl-L-alanine amidase [Candidatus Omnitrophota bacterium]
MPAKKQYNYFILLIISFFLCSLTVSGCSSTGSVSVGGKVGRSFVRLDRKQYVPLKVVCDQYDLSWDWDGFSKIITVKNLKLNAKLFAGSELILFNNEVFDLKSQVKVHKGQILVPESFLRLFAKEKLLLQLKRKSAFSIRKIVIDAGHGGKDPGAIGKNGIQEKDIVLDIALRLKNELTKQGIDVILTRDTDIFHPLKKRSEIANKEKADFFISIHANAFHASSVNGFEAFYLSTGYDDFSKAVQIRENAVIKFEEDADYEYSSDLNATLWDMILSENRIESIEMANSISDELKRTLKLNTRYIRGAKFHVLKGANMPAVLLEMGYLTNKNEAAQLDNAYYRQMLAEAVTVGIVRYKRLFELSDGFSK